MRIHDNPDRSGPNAGRPAPVAPAPVAPAPGVRASRRAVLVGVAGLLGGATVVGAAGCGPFGEDPGLEPSPLDGFVTSTAALADRYDAAVAANPDLTALIPLRDAHRAHLAALASSLGRATPPLGSAEAVTGGRAAVFAALAAAEKAARDEAVAACLAGTPRLAGLLGSIAAARASHLEVLG